MSALEIIDSLIEAEHQKPSDKFSADVVAVLWDVKNRILAEDVPAQVRPDLLPKDELALAMLRTSGSSHKVLSLERRFGDSITNAHLHRLANEGFRIIGGAIQMVGHEPHFIISFTKAV